MTGVPRAWVQNCGRWVRRHSGGARVLHHMRVLVAKPVGSRGLSFQNLDDYDGLTRNVVWQVAASGALRRQALEKLRRFIFDRDALAASLANSPSTCQEWALKVDMATSTLRRF